VPKTTSIDSELRGICSICDGDDAIKARLLSVLQPQHFACEETAEIFTRIMGLAKNSKQIPKVLTLRNDPTLSQGAQDVLGSEIEVCAGVDDAEALVDQLELYRKLRVIYENTVKITDSIKDTSTESVESALAAAERMILQARSNYQESQLITSGAGSNAEPIVEKVLSQAKPDRILTGFTQFDEASGGWARKDLVLIAATTGGGKSVMAEQLAINAYYKTGQNRNVALVSFEMDEEELYARLIANLSGTEFQDVYLRKLAKTYNRQQKCREAWQKFNRHGEEHDCRFTVWCPTMDVTPSQVGAFLRPAGYDLVLIDYVGLVAPEQKAQLWENLGEITREFKGVARRNNCVVAVMAQLDEETNKVKYSKAMRHHSSYVWKWNWGEMQEESKQITVEQEKARHCKRFPFNLMAQFAYMRIHDVSSDDVTEKDVTSKEENKAKAIESKPSETKGECSPEELRAHLMERRCQISNLDDDYELDEDDQ